MNKYVWMCVACLLSMSVLTGCGKSNNVETGKLESSFSSAPPATKSNVDAAVSAIKAGNYADAMTKLQAIGAKVKLTPEQQQAIQDIIAQVQKQIAAATEKMQKDTGAAMGNLQNPLKK